MHCHTWHAGHRVTLSSHMSLSQFCFKVARVQNWYLRCWRIFNIFEYPSAFQASILESKQILEHFELFGRHVSHPIFFILTSNSLLLIRIQMETLSVIVLVLSKYFVESDPPSDCIDSEKILVKTDMDMRFRATQLKFAVVIYGPWSL